MASPRQQLITDAVLARLQTLSGVTMFRGEVGVSPPIVAETGRIAPYAVLFPFGPADGTESDLADSASDLTYTCQITCVAGYAADVEWVADQVSGLMNRWTPVVSGIAFGRFHPPVGFSPGVVHRDDTVKPPRYTLPLQYRITATT